MDRRVELIAEMTPAIWLHLIAVAIAVGLGAWVLLRRKGDRLHRMLGRIWVGLMAVGAISSFWIMEIFEGSFSPIHALSVYTLVSLVLGLWAIRQGQVELHRRCMMSLYATGLVIAGGFTFLPERLLGRLTFGESYPLVNYVFLAAVVLLGLWLYRLSFAARASVPNREE